MTDLIMMILCNVSDHSQNISIIHVSIRQKDSLVEKTGSNLE